MARVERDTVAYFPHDALASKSDTLTILQSRFGNDGYAAWFKILEKLASSDKHIIDLRAPMRWQLFTAYLGIKEITTVEIMDLLVEIGAIDKDLWGTKLIWCQKLVNNLASVYKNRKRDLPVKPITTPDNTITTNSNGVTTPCSTQSKVEEVNKSKVEEVNKSKVDTSTLLGFTVEVSWLDDLIKEYPELDIRFEEKRCFDWWTGQRKTIKNAKNAMRNWCINQRKFNAENPGKKQVAALPSAEQLRKEWGDG